MPMMATVFPILTPPQYVDPQQLTPGQRAEYEEQEKLNALHKVGYMQVGALMFAVYLVFYPICFTYIREAYLEKE